MTFGDLTTRRKPPQLVLFAGWHEKCCRRKIIFCSDFAQLPVI